MAETHNFQAEIKQLLQILIHSLYKDREIFLRELISNASDALSKIQFEMLTNRDVVDADTELQVQIEVDSEANTLRIMDTGIGMTADEIVENLGVIARSGARSFAERLAEAEDAATLIGQFGVGFYSVFMVADRVEVTSRSYLPEAEAVRWISSGEDSYEIEPADKTERGTDILIHLREDAQEFSNNWKIRDIVKRHSDYLAFPIYLIDLATDDTEEAEAEEKAPEAINQQTAIWRRPTSEIDDQEYNDFYRMFTMDFDEPVMRIHSRGDAPIQYFALLYLPKTSERNMFSLRKEPGLKLYVRKVLIQEYTTDLLPEYLQFVHGVVDSEDLPLNVSRETVQANAQITKLKQVLTRRILTDLGRLANNEPETYAGIWQEYGSYFKHGIVTEYSDRERLLPLLRFNTSQHTDELIALDQYVEAMEATEGQESIYYLIADSQAVAANSPHLDPFQARGLDVLYLTDPVDGFFVNALNEYKGYKLVSVDAADLDLEGVGETPTEEETTEAVEQDALDQLVIQFKDVLGERVESVRVSKVMTSGSPVRLVAPEGAMDRHTQRVYKMLERDFEVPARILEINARHPIIHNLSKRLERGLTDSFFENALTTLYGNALLADGIHPNPADMVRQIQVLMEAATDVD